MTITPYKIIKQQIHTWLKRKTLHTAVRRASDMPIVLGTDTGILRKENQDRLAMMRFTPDNTNSEAIVIALADGMGGMVGGADAASIAISSFFSSLVKYSDLGISSSLIRAAEDANDDVCAIYNAKGGATLSAIMVHKGDVVGVNVGDSRIYSIDETHLSQLSEDDTIAALAQKYRRHDEGFDEGFGHELVQFIGQDYKLEPHLISFERGKDNKIMLTSDGAHLIGESNLFKIAKNSPELPYSVKRIIDLANWFGGVDNASMAIIEIDLLSLDEKVPDGTIRIWDPFGDMQLFLLISDAVENDASKSKNKESILSLAKENKETDEERRLKQKRNAAILKNKKTRERLNKNFIPEEDSEVDSKEKAQIDIRFGEADKNEKE